MTQIKRIFTDFLSPKTKCRHLGGDRYRGFRKKGGVPNGRPLYGCGVVTSIYSKVYHTFGDLSNYSQTLLEAKAACRSDKWLNLCYYDPCQATVPGLAVAPGFSIAEGFLFYVYFGFSIAR